LTALQNDERANYQLDVKFQESYLKRVVALLQCQLSEGAVSNGVLSHGEVHSGESLSTNDLEEGELPDSHGLLPLNFLNILFLIIILQI
jgi:endoribonuclease Dicer